MLIPAVAGMLLAVAEGPSDVERALARAAALQHLAAELAQAGTLEQIGELAVTAGAGVSGADAAGAYLRPQGTDTLELVHARGWPEDTVRRFGRIELERGRPLSDCVLVGEPVWLEDVEQWRTRYPAVAAVGTAIGYDATACLPMRTDGRVLGAVAFSYAGPRAFPAAEREFLKAVTALCTQAFERVRLTAAERTARTEIDRQLRWTRFLAGIGPLLEGPLTVEERLQRLADAVAAEVADWCAVQLVRDDRVEQVAVAHADPAKLAFVADLQRRYPPGPHAERGAIHVSRTGETVHYSDIPDELLADAARDAEHLELLRSIGMRSAVVAPLKVRGTSLGALTLVQAESGRTFDATDLAFVRQLAAGAAVALDNARLYEQQRAVADTLQHALLPEALPTAPGLRLAARYRPSGPDPTGLVVGGDLYDVVEAGPGRWAVTVGDVCGKGPQAAALTAMIRHTVRTEVRHGLGPAEVLGRLNDAMIRDSGAEVARFATVVHAHVQVGPSGADVEIVNAGHLSPLLLRGGGVEPIEAPGSLLGVYPDVRLTRAAVRLDPGDALVLYTDGITEARRGVEFYREERLSELLAGCAGGSAEAIADAVLVDVTAFDGGRSHDDMAVLVVQAEPVSGRACAGSGRR